MVDYARAGRAIGVFVEGTRQRETKRPGVVQPGAAMVAVQADVPVVPVAVYGTQFWSPWNRAPCTIAVGEPFRFEGVPRGGKGYREGSLEIGRRLNVLFDWLAEMHARDGPKGGHPRYEATRRRGGASRAAARRPAGDGGHRRLPERRASRRSSTA